VSCAVGASLAVLLLVWACGRSSNSVAAFLDGAQMQAETYEQQRQVRRVLRDMLRMTAAELKERRYANERMEPGVWTAPEILSHYFVPRGQAVLDDERFYLDVKEKPAQKVVRRQLTRLEAELDPR
jgi:hypothetical protein